MKSWYEDQVQSGLLLIGPLAVALMATLTVKNYGPTPQPSGLASAMFFIWFTDSGHVVASALFAHSHKELMERIKRRLALVLGAATVLSGLLFLFNFQLFKILLGYVGLSHIILQHYGWLRRIQKREPMVIKRFATFERYLFFALILGPLYFWHTGGSAVSLSYFFADNLILRSSPEYWPIVNAATLIALLGLSITSFVIFRKTQSLSRFIFFATTAIWFYGGLVLAPTDVFFWTYLICCHGWTYICHNRTLGSRTLPIEVHVLLILALGGLWFSFRQNLDSPVSFWAWLAWLPLLFHYSFDSIVWRRNLPNMTPHGS